MEKNELIIRYDNDLTQTPLKGLSAVELNVFFYLLYRLQGRGTEKTTIGFDELKTLIQYKSGNSRQRLKEDLYRLKSHLLGIQLCARNICGPGTTTIMNIFSSFTTDDDNTYLKVSLTEDFAYLLNNNIRCYTEMEYIEYRNLGSIFSKHLYRQLKAWKSVGEWAVDIETFRELICVPESYRSYDIDRRVLGAALDELKHCFENLKVKKEYESRKGKPLSKLIFTFTPQKGENVVRSGIICKECGRPLVEKRINGSLRWCHEDGWKDDAACKAIFNSVAEATGFEETPARKKDCSSDSDRALVEEMPEEIREKWLRYKEQLTLEKE